jgi:hypothetical protein
MMERVQEEIPGMQREARRTQPTIRYEHWKWAYENYNAFLHSLALRPNVRRVLDVGGGARPTLPLDFIQKHGLDYTVVDISDTELAKAPAEYHKVCADITGDIATLKARMPEPTGVMAQWRARYGALKASDMRSRSISVSSAGAT